MDVLSPEDLVAQLDSANSGITEDLDSPSTSTVTPAVVQATKAEPTEKTFTLPNGRVVSIKKPLSPVAFEVAKILGYQSNNPALEMYYTAMKWITQIAQLRIEAKHNNSEKGMQTLLNAIGDDGLQMLLSEVGALSAGIGDLDLDLLGK